MMAIIWYPITVSMNVSHAVYSVRYAHPRIIVQPVAMGTIYMGINVLMHPIAPVYHMQMSVAVNVRYASRPVCSVCPGTSV